MSRTSYSRMKSLGHVASAILGLIAVVNARPNCRTTGTSDVVCTAGDDDHVLQRGLVSDNNQTTSISLRNCRITEVDYEAFENDHNLKSIDLSVNKISTLKLGVLDGNHKVTFLNLSYNLLTSFPLGLFDEKPNLEVLDLKGNRLNFLELGVFDSLGKIAYLDLSSNALLGKNIDPYIFDKSKKIKHLMDFSRNDMNDSPENLLHAFDELEFLRLDRCSLKEVPRFATRPNLKTMKHLMLSTNQIKKIDQPGTFTGLDNLEIINLAENLIEDIAADVFQSLKMLKQVVLRNNRLKAIPVGLFMNLKAIGNIDISYNLIGYVSVNEFRSAKLNNLNLSHNKFTYLDANFILETRNSGVILKKFYFNDNPWQCACLMEILKETKTFNIKYNSVKYNGEKVICATTRRFTCLRQTGVNELFIDLYKN